MDATRPGPADHHQLFLADRYQSLGQKLAPAYASAEPFPHQVLDDFLPESICEQLLGEFPAPGQLDWHRFDRHHSKKLGTRGDRQFGPHTRDAMHLLNGAAFLQFLEALTGIDGLIPDPHFEGGGLHQIEPGGHLKIHADFNWHKKLRLDRRINFILYLNKNWCDAYNGHLELWDRRMTRCVAKVLPVFNRCVIFSTNSTSFHGHPEKLACPPGQTRKSLALYYYSNGRPDEEQGTPHGTLWQERPAQGRFRRLAATIAQAPASLFRQLTTGSKSA